MISIIIPAYCEENQIPQTLREVGQVSAGLGEEVEIILVDDGSSDETAQVAQSHRKDYPQLKVISHEGNRGLGAALRTGFQNSQGDKVVTLDCDLSFDPKFIPQILAPLSQMDVVIGAQHAKGGGMENIPSYRIFLSKLAYQLDRGIFGGNLSSYTSMFVAYRGPLIRALEFQSNTFAGQCEILVRLCRKGVTMGAVPVPLAWRDRNRVSSMNLLAEGQKRMGLWWRLNRFRKVN